jgi:hypothetical protein
MVKDVKFCRTSEPEANRVRVIIVSKEERGEKKREDRHFYNRAYLGRIFGMRASPGPSPSPSHNPGPSPNPNPGLRIHILGETKTRPVQDRQDKTRQD